MYDKKTQTTLYAMARVVTELVPEIRESEACRAVLRAAGFPARMIGRHLRMVQHIARRLRAADAEILVRKERANS